MPDSNSLVVLERQFELLAPRFGQVLGHLMPPERLIRTVLNSCERTPKLFDCDRQSLFNAAMTGAVLGLEADGVTGQLFLIPFDDRRNNRSVVQPVIGYKGYNTIGARSRLTITGRVVREGDEFDFDEGAGIVHHRKKLGGNGRIIAIWAKAAAHDRPAVVRVLSIDEIMAVKEKSPNGKRPPWSDSEIGFPAMAEKTGKRRLARDLPLSVYQSAARMDEAFEEQGLHSWIHPDNGVTIEGNVLPPRHTTETPTVEQLTSPPNLKDEALMAAQRGRDTFEAFCKRLTKPQYYILKQYLETLRPVVEKAENEYNN